jgi:hypothetical protein
MAAPGSRDPVSRPAAFGRPVRRAPSRHGHAPRDDVAPGAGPTARDGRRAAVPA